MIKNQIETLTLGPSFGHNLCYKYSNGSCKRILNIYVFKKIQWYNELFNLMSFDLSNYYLKIWKSVGFSTPKVGVHFKVCGFIPSHSRTPRNVSVTLGLHFRLAPLHALALVVSPRLWLWHHNCCPHNVKWDYHYIWNYDVQVFTSVKSC
jgi:hypothetical protein